MRHRIDLGNWKSIAGTTVLAAGLTLFAGAGIAKADDCQERIVKADHKLHEAIEHHAMRAGRRNTGAWNYITRGNTAGRTRTSGGMRKETAGTVITIGMTTIMITTTTIMTTIASNS